MAEAFILTLVGLLVLQGTAVPFPAAAAAFDEQDLVVTDDFSSYGPNLGEGRYDVASQKWSSLLSAPLHDGEGVRNAYSNGPTVGPDGRFHVIWVWRETADAATNHAVHCAVSDDLINWERADGTALSLPLQEGDGDLISSVPVNKGLLNGWTRIGFDSQNNVVIVFSHHDQNNNQQTFAARYGGLEWQVAPVTNWRGRAQLIGGGSLSFPFNLIGVKSLPGGDLAIEYRCHSSLESLVLDGSRRLPLGMAATPPPLPAVLHLPESTFPGIEVQRSVEEVSDGTRQVLRWETLPGNQDQPRVSWLEAEPLRVYRLAPVDN